MRRRLMPLIAFAFFGLITGCASTSGTRTKVYVPREGGTPLYKSYSSPGQNVTWDVTKWLSYGGPSAKAIAWTYVNTCERSCAGGPHIQARTTVAFNGRVPCDGVSAYAAYRVIKTSNPKAAPVGEVVNLWGLCGYAAFTPSLPCLSQHNRAASTAVQARCYVAAIRAQNTRIAKSDRSLSTLLYDAAQGQSEWDDQNLAVVHPEHADRIDDRVAQAARRAFEAGERGWRAYRRGFCTSNFDSPKEAPNVVYDACLYQLNGAHLHALNAQSLFSG